MRGHPAGLGADKKNEVGGIDHASGALARIGADHPHRERMVARNDILAVERGGDRDLQRLGQCDDLAASARRAHTAAGDDHRLVGFL